ncbi:MAG: response regulator transcription factor [Chitinophagaceae bacterium]
MNDFNFLTCIVDDDPIWTNLLMQTLKNAGLNNISTFKNGIEFLHDQQNCPKIIFLDYQMDNMNGLEVLQCLKKRNPETQVIFCTSIEDLNVAISALSYGSKDFLLKSNINKQEITSVLNQVFPSFVHQLNTN